MMMKPLESRAWGAGLLVGVLAVFAACGGEEAPDEDEGGAKRIEATRMAIGQVEDRLGDLLEQEATRRARVSSVETILSSGAADGQPRLQHLELVRGLYQSRNYRPIWYRPVWNGTRLSEAGQTLARRLRDGVVAHGFWPDQMHLTVVEEARRAAREACCSGTLARLRLRPEERGALVDAFVDQSREIPVDDPEAMAADVVELTARADGPTPRLGEAVVDRVEQLERRSLATAAVDLYLTDALAEYIHAMKWSNPTWHQPRGWHATFRLGDRGPLRSGRKADSKEDGGSAARQVGEAVEAARAEAFTAETMRRVADKPDEADSIAEDTIPRFRQYRRLVEAFKRYRPVVERGGWPEVPTSAVGLEPGYHSPAVATLKERLRLEGYYEVPRSEDTGVENRFDDELEAAVRAYQQTHQLYERGHLTEQTLRSLNVSARQRWNQIRVTLQRWRQSRIGPDTHYVHVNIPDFHAEVWRDGVRQMRFRVVTGSSDRERREETGEVLFPNQTPRFSDKIEYIVFNPYWNVPHGIWKNELEPKLEENPDFYEEEGYEVVVDDNNGYKFLRQKPGPENSLGRMKFLFPNEHSVYLHDTPAKSLFDRPTRALSHGCVRIQDPMKFADYLLDLDGRWTGEAREKQKEKWFDKEGETWVTLQQELAVHLEYYVVRVDQNGRAHFLADVYELDEPRLDRVARQLETFPDGYDLDETDPDAMMRRALAGRLESRPTPGSPWTDPEGPSPQSDQPVEAPSN